MNRSRIEQLEEFLKENPNDPFNLYALALEYQKSDQIRAEALYEKLLREHSSYIATYYHAGNFYLKKGKKDLAENVFKRGLEESKKAGNNHAFRELQSALNELLSDEQDD
jgi:tetratricopeptide (TPR) repeat protein